MKSYYRIRSIENPNEYLTKIPGSDKNNYIYSIKGTRFDLDNAELVNLLSKQYNGKVILTEPVWEYE